MTVLITCCPFCDSNFMVLNTDTANGQCITCGKEKEFTEEEISAAESRRDMLSEKYVSAMEKAFNEKDYDTMAELAEKVANEGISSWYAWFCVGWSALQEENLAEAMEDFRLAVMFLDEENFDEFYELVMDAVLESMLEAAKNDRVWMDGEATLVDFTGILFDRFEHLCESGDFMVDLTYRAGTLTDDIPNASTGGNLIKELMMVVLDYFSGNLYVPDRQDLLYNTKEAVNNIDVVMKEKVGDGTLPRNTIEIWGPGCIDFLDLLISMGDRVQADYSDEDMLSLCDYWGEQYGDLFGMLQNAFEYHMGFLLSNYRNKGIGKKRDKALKDYETAFIRPLAEGLLQEGSDEEDFDRICPECGKYLLADETGLMVCECGFRSRVVTADILDLPKSVPQLVQMGREALGSKDPMMLNNIGERILEFDKDNWFGFLCLAESCVVDGEIGEALMLFSQSAENLTPDGVEEYKATVVEEVGRSMSELDDPEQHVSTVFIPALLESINLSPAKDADISLSIFTRMSDGDYNRSNRGFAVTVLVSPAFTFEMLYHTGISYQRRACATFIALLDKVMQGMEGIKRDADNSKDDVVNYSRIQLDLMHYFLDSLDAKVEGMDEERKGFYAGYWSANKGDYQNLISDLVEAFTVDEDTVYKPNSKHMLKAKHSIDRYLEDYFGVKEE